MIKSISVDDLKTNQEVTLRRFKDLLCAYGVDRYQMPLIPWGMNPRMIKYLGRRVKIAVIDWNARGDNFRIRDNTCWKWSPELIEITKFNDDH